MTSTNKVHEVSPTTHGDVRLTQEHGWLSDNAGRIENISLAPNVKNALFPLFETVLNSIQAIEERFGKDHLADGWISIFFHKGRRIDVMEWLRAPT